MTEDQFLDRIGVEEGLVYAEPIDLREAESGGRSVTAMNSHPNRVFAKAQSSAPLCDGQCLSAVRHIVVIASIVVLLLTCGPSTVTRLVRAVGIDPVDAVASFRTRPHISKERIEVVTPFRAHRDTAGTVVLELFHGRVETSLFGVLPRLVLSAALHAVLPVERRTYLLEETAAASNHACDEVTGIYVSDLSALASTAPARSATRGRIDAIESGQASESLAG